MLIWLGVVGTVLALCGVLGCWLLFSVGGVFREAMKDLQTVRESFWNLAKRYEFVFEQEHEEMGKMFSSSIKDFGVQADRSLADWKQASSGFTKSEQELADNLGALLREVKVSKQLAQGALAVVEQNVLAVDKLWQMVEMIRTGPRAAPKIAPTDADAAAHEAGDDEAQQLAIEAQLQNAASRMREVRENFGG
jgi:hypothetical protein